MADYFCEYCGTSAQSVANLTGQTCFRHPNGPNKARHSLYQGSKKDRYTCKYCGTNSNTIANLTGQSCFRHPAGTNKGKHHPAL